MNFPRNIIQATAGGLFGGSLLGLAEAVYQLSANGAPDLLAPVYAFILYGLLGLPVGFGTGIALSVLEKIKELGERAEALAFCFGAAAAVTPFGLFIGHYLANKVIYLEKGVPMSGLIGILGAIAVLDLIILTFGVALVHQNLKFLRTGPGVGGAWAAIAALAGLLVFVPLGNDPRGSWGHGKPVPTALQDKPNVLLIMVDTLRADYLGTYGKEGNPSPNLDALANDSIVFENAFAAASWTRASGASLMSSRIPSSHNAAVKAARLPDEVVTWSEVLQNDGVTTGALINNINLTSTFNFDQGYDTFIYEAPAYSFGATESVFGLTLYKVVHKINEKLGGAKHVHSFYQPVDTLVDDTKGFIEANKNSRWALFMHLMEPHDPYFEHPSINSKWQGSGEYNGIGFARAEVEHPDPADAEYLKQVYLEEITFMDQKLAPFIEWMKSSGTYDNTLIVITADHGEEFNEHGGFWHGTTLYEEQIHIPLIVKLPKQDLAGTRVKWQARSIDVAPTIAGALGINPDESWEGSDLIADVRREIADLKAAEEAKLLAAQQPEEATDAPDNEEAELDEATADDAEENEEADASEETEATEEGTPAEPPEENDPCAAYGHALDRLVISEQDFEGNVLSSIRTNGFKYIKANEGNPRGLPTMAMYDMVTDRLEMNNLAESEDSFCGSYQNDRRDGLNDQLGKAIVEAAKGASASSQACMSAAEVQRLVALGYMDAAAADEQQNCEE